MPRYSTHSHNQAHSSLRLFDRERSLHDILGGGKVADILFWEDKKLSAGILAGFTIIWLLFEVAEYHFVTLLCHILIIAMLIIFIWSTVAALTDRSLPNFYEIRIPESTYRYFFAKLNWFLYKFCEISSGKDLRHFFLTIGCLWMLSAIGTNLSSLSLLYTVYLCMQTLPVLYERYETEVDYLASRGNRDAKEMYRKFESKVLNKIPRGPVKERKFK